MRVEDGGGGNKPFSSWKSTGQDRTIRAAYWMDEWMDTRTHRSGKAVRSGGSDMDLAQDAADYRTCCALRCFFSLRLTSAPVQMVASWGGC